MIIYKPKEFWTPGSRNVGEEFHIDSGLGGSFTLKIASKSANGLTFRCVSKGWEDWGKGHLTYTPEEASKTIFILKDKTN